MVHTQSEQQTQAVLRREAVRVAAPVQVGRGAHPHEFDVAIRRDGDVIRAIEIRCRCGERIVLDCSSP